MWKDFVTQKEGHCSTVLTLTRKVGVISSKSSRFRPNFLRQSLEWEECDGKLVGTEEEQKVDEYQRLMLNHSLLSSLENRQGDETEV